MKISHSFQRVIKYEFWPLWVFYSPFVLQWMYNSLRSGSFLYFMRANPGIKFGGLFQNSKYDVLKQINQAFLPKTLFVDTTHPDVEAIKSSVGLPFICKPDIGERGKGVSLIRKEEDWTKLQAELQFPYLLQEYIDYKHELGILYYRRPEGESGITSIVSKRFLTVKGDGESTLKALIENDLRASGRLNHLFKKFRERLTEILPLNEELLLEEIGNHCRGTAFYNSNDLINAKLVKLFDQIAEPIEEFYYGRIDLKVSSIEDLYQGKNIKIMEVNGVNSEVTHIYDPEYSLLRAYKDVAYNLDLVYRIAKQNKRKKANVNFKELSMALKEQFLS